MEGAIFHWVPAGVAKMILNCNSWGTQLRGEAVYKNPNSSQGEWAEQMCVDELEKSKFQTLQFWESVYQVLGGWP